MADTPENNNLTAQTFEEKGEALSDGIKGVISEIVKKEGPMQGFQDLTHPDGSSFTDGELLEATRNQYFDQAWRLITRGMSEDQIINYFREQDEDSSSNKS